MSEKVFININEVIRNHYENIAITANHELSKVERRDVKNAINNLGKYGYFLPSWCTTEDYLKMNRYLQKAISAAKHLYRFQDNDFHALNSRQFDILNSRYKNLVLFYTKDYQLPITITENEIELAVIEYVRRVVTRSGFPIKWSMSHGLLLNLRDRFVNHTGRDRIISYQTHQLFIPYAYSILEGLISIQYDENDKIFKPMSQKIGDLKYSLSRAKKEKSTISNTNYFVKSSVLSALEKNSYFYTDFRDSDNQIYVSRNSIAHGLISPSEWTRVDFIKIWTVIQQLAEINSIISENNRGINL